MSQPISRASGGSMNRRDALAGLLGLAVALPSRSVFAQGAKGRSARVGVLCIAQVTEKRLRSVPSELAKLGWAEGSNLVIDWRNANGELEALPRLAGELLALGPDVILADGNVTTQSLMQQGRAIPVLVFASLDPVGVGLARSVARPGGNVTGLMWSEPTLAAKIVSLLHESVPRARRLAVIYDPGVPGIQAYVEADRTAAVALGMEMRDYHVRSAKDLTNVLESLSMSGTDAIKAALSGHFSGGELPIVLDYALGKKIPVVSVSSIAAQLGALLAYSPSNSERIARISGQLDNILRGAKPAEMPFEFPTRLELAINLRTAKALGITVPSSVLMRADHLIE